MRRAYPDDLTDKEWELIEPILNEKMIKQGRTVFQEGNFIRCVLCFTHRLPVEAFAP